MNAFACVRAIQTHLRQCVLLCTIYWISQCAADKNLENFRNGDDIVQVYTLLPHFRPVEKEYGSTARVWVIILGVLGGIVFVLTCFFCYYALQGRPFFRQGPSSNSPAAAAAAVHPSPSAPPLSERNSWNRVSTRSEGPPDYTSVTLGVNRLNVPEHKQEKLETPPPAYITVAPFK